MKYSKWEWVLIVITSPIWVPLLVALAFGSVILYALMITFEFFNMMQGKIK